MYTKIENYPFFDDIKSEVAKNNMTSLVNYLCSMPVYKEQEEEIMLDGIYEAKHDFLSKILYNPQNRILANDILKNKTDMSTIEEVYGYSYIYETNRDKLIILGNMDTYRSVAVLEHELTHTLMALNNNNPREEHNEVLSLFIELLSLYLLSDEENNPDIYENAFINRYINRMSYRVYPSDFSDEYISKHTEWLLKAHKDGYPYMIGIIYAARLLDIYMYNEEEVLYKVNEVLSGKKTLEDLLDEYNINLEDEPTLNSFYNSCDIYKYFVLNKHDEMTLHYVL